MSIKQFLDRLSDGFGSNGYGMAFRALLFVWVVLLLCGYVFIATDLLPERFSWTASIILFLSTAVVLLSEARVRSVRRNVVLALVLFAGACIVEYIGIRTGLPFGAYTYTDALGFRLVGVPVAIAAAWYTTIMITRTIARAVFPPGIATALAAGILTLAFDIALEPMASYIESYWQWTEGRIPLQNYASWFVLSASAVFLLERYDPLPAAIPTRAVLKTSLLVFLLQFGLFLIADSLFKYASHVVIAMLVVGMTAILWRLRHHTMMHREISL
ncbi:MAG: hypothetical protein C4326_07375 [Ignavibacteria bacterium]